MCQPKGNYLLKWCIKFHSKRPNLCNDVFWDVRCWPCAAHDVAHGRGWPTSNRWRADDPMSSALRLTNAWGCSKYFHFKLFLTWESWSSPTCALFLRLKITILSIFPSTILPQDNLIVRTGRGCGVERAGGRVGRCPNQLFLTYFCAILSSCVLVNCCLTTLSSSSSSSSSMLNSKFCKVI